MRTALKTLKKTVINADRTATNKLIQKVFGMLRAYTGVVYHNSSGMCENKLCLLGCCRLWRKQRNSLESWVHRVLGLSWRHSKWRDPQRYMCLHVDHMFNEMTHDCRFGQEH